MPEDASLDDFLPTPSATDDEEGDRSDDEAGQSTDATSESDGDTEERESPVEERGAAVRDSEPVADSEDATAAPTAERASRDPTPPAATSRWTLDGATCPGCDGVASRLWRDGDRLVCADCKSWADG